MQKIMVISHYNLNNGDRAVLEGTLEILKDSGVKEISLSVFNKEIFKTSIEGININLVPWGVNYKSKIKGKLFNKILPKLGINSINKYAKFIYNKCYLEAIKESDIIFVSGGHHLTDIVGDEAFYKLSFDMIYPLIMGKRVILLPQTIGPFKNPNLKKVNILKFILKNAELIAVRDNNSLEFIKRIEVKTKNINVLPDMVFGLYNVLNKMKEEKQHNSIGIALYGNYSGKGAKEKIKKYLDQLTATINNLKGEFIINFIPMEVKDSLGDDRKLIEYIKETVIDNSKINILEENENILSTIKNFSKNEMIIAYKTHSVLFSLLQHIPVIAVAYHRKSIDFMDMYNIKDYAIWDKDVTSENLVQLVRKIQKNREQIIDIETEKNIVMYKNLAGFIKKIVSVN